MRVILTNGPAGHNFRGGRARARQEPCDRADVNHLLRECVGPPLAERRRIGGRRERVPVLVTLGVRGNGERVVLDLRLVGEESAASWTEVVASLTARHLVRPVLAIIDGNPGLMNALQSHWPGIEIP